MEVRKKEVEMKGKVVIGRIFACLVLTLVSSGDSLEGWITFQVAIDDNKPLMTFTADPTGVVHHGGNIWFQLYPAP